MAYRHSTPVLQCLRVSTTTVRLDDDDKALLDALAPQFGGRSSVIRHALQVLAAERRRHDALRSFVAEWDAADGPSDDADVAAMADRFGL